MKFLKILTLILLIILLMWSLLNYYILPVKGKSYLVTSLERILERNVQIDEFSYSLTEGFILKNLSVKTKENITAKNLIETEKVCFDILLAPLIAKRKIIITNLHISKPTINLIKKQNKELNIDDLLKAKKLSPERKKIDILVTSLEVFNGQIKYSDLSSKSIYEETISNIFINYNYLLPFTVKFKASFDIEKENASFQSTGSYNLRSKKVYLEGNLEGLRLSRLAPYVNLPPNIKEMEGISSTEFKSTINSEKILIFKGNTRIENLNIETGTLNIDGIANVTSNIEYDLAKKTLLAVKGNIDLENVKIEGVPYVQRITNLEGKITFNKEQITFKELEGEVLNCLTTFNGTLKNDQNLYLDLIVTSKLNLNKVLEILQTNQKESFKDIRIKGQTDATLNISGQIRRLISLDMTGNVSFSDISIESEKSVFALTNANGKMLLSKDKVELVDFTAIFRGMQYNINGALTNFAKPHLDFKIISDNLFCSTILDIKDNMVYIRKAKGNYFSNEFQLTGEITNLSSPDFNIYGDVILDLNDLDRVIRVKSKVISKLELKGKCPSYLHFKGKPHEWKKAEVGFKSSAKKVYVKGLKLDNLYFNLAMRNQKVLINNFSFNPYDGTLTLSGEIDLQSQSPSYSISVVANSINLEKLTKDTKLKDKNISGTAFSKLYLTNPLKDLSGVSGKGSFLIMDGRLFEVPLLRSLAKVMGMPALEKTVFNEAYADFIIQNRNISTENLNFLSKTLSLKSKGSVDFKGNLNFITNLELPGQMYEDYISKDQIAAMFFSLLGKYFIKVKTTGTISNPQYKLAPVSSKELFKNGLFIKGLEGILKGF